MAIFLLGIVAIILLGVWIIRVLWVHYGLPLAHLNLPPGSLGWPYVGETIQLFSQNPNIFFSSRQQRYGEIFKTHILGCPAVMLASPEAIKFVLVTKANLFKNTFPTTKERLIGHEALFFHDGEYHAKMRRLVQKSLMPEAIREMIPQIEVLANSFLLSWEGQTINTFLETKKISIPSHSSKDILQELINIHAEFNSNRYTFNVGIHMLFGNNVEVPMRDDLENAYCRLEKAYNSMAINLPWTNYYKAIKARKYLHNVIKDLIKKRRTSYNDEKVQHHDLLSNLMGFKDEHTNKELSEKQVADNIIGLIFAARDTTACVFTWFLKFLKEAPHVLQSLILEHERVRKGKPNYTDPLTWLDIKSMQLTSQAIQETMRLATVLSFTFREAIEDVDYKGYIIPKGWKAMPLFRCIHHSPENFPDPFKFDPTRFELPTKANTFLPFGLGVHCCLGYELSKLEIIILFHHLITKFKWDIVGNGSGVRYIPFPVPTDGLPINIRRIHDDNEASHIIN